MLSAQNLMSHGSSVDHDRVLGTLSEKPTETTTVVGWSSPTSKATSSQLLNHPFFQRMASEPGFREIPSLSRKLRTPALLNVGRRTWAEMSGQSVISAFYLTINHTGYVNLIHGGVLAALIDQVCAEYCNRAAPSLYPLTRYLGVEFEKPSPPGELFIAKVSTSRPVPLDINVSRKAWIECEIWIPYGDAELMPVVKAKVLFILCERLPILHGDGGLSNKFEELFKRKGSGTEVAVRTPRSSYIFRGLILIAAMLVGLLGFI